MEKIQKNTAKIWPHLPCASFCQDNTNLQGSNRKRTKKAHQLTPSLNYYNSQHTLFPVSVSNLLPTPLPFFTARRRRRCHHQELLFAVGWTEYLPFFVAPNITYALRAGRCYAMSSYTFDLLLKCGDFLYDEEHLVQIIWSTWIYSILFLFLWFIFCTIFEKNSLTSHFNFKKSILQYIPSYNLQSSLSQTCGNSANGSVVDYLNTRDDTTG